MAAEVRDLLETGVVYFPGSVDRFRNPLLFVRLELAKFLDTSSALELKCFFNYFISISKDDVKENGYVFLLDCTRSNQTTLADFLELLHDYFAANIIKVYVVQNPTEEGIVSRAYMKMKTLLSNMQGNGEYPRITLNGYSEMDRIIDANQIPCCFDGQLDFDQKLWVETRIELEKLLQDHEECLSLISSKQESLIKAIPSTLNELDAFEKAIQPLRTLVYLPTLAVCDRAKALIEEEKIARSGGSGSSRFRYCPLSIIHVIDSRALQSTHEKLTELNENFMNLWGLQLQKICLEKYSIASSMLHSKLSDLAPTVLKSLELNLVNTESQYHFYASIHTTLIGEDVKLYDCAVNAHACLRDWNHTARLPTDDLEVKVSELNKSWADMVNAVSMRYKLLSSYSTLKAKLAAHSQTHEKCCKMIDGISVSENIADNIALPIRHHSITDSIQTFIAAVATDIAEVNVSEDVVAGNVNVAELNRLVKQARDRNKKLSHRNNQCLAIKEQISLFFSSIKDIKDWIKKVGKPFLSNQSLGHNLEESKQGKTAFLMFIANSGLDGTKQRMTQCSKTLSVILNSQFLDDPSVNIIRDTYNQTEVDWKGFGLEVQEHSQDLELSIEFYEAAQTVSSWLKEEKSSVTLNTETGNPEEDLSKLAKFKENMRQTSSVMDVCHTKYIELSASSNSTLRHIRTAKQNVDSSWTKFSEQVRNAEREIERRYKEQIADNATTDNASLQETSSVGSLDFNDESEHVAFRNTKMLVQELVNTEQAYVRDLKDVVVGYKTRMEQSADCPAALKTNIDTIFGNIEEIYNFHSKIFLGELERCSESSNVGSVFCTNITNFEMYASYCKNKPRSENFLSCTNEGAYLKQCQREVNHILDLGSYLLKPVQRIMKYHLILEKLLKYAPARNAKRKEELQRALDIMERVPRYANDVIHLMGLEGYNGNFEVLGQLLLQESFLVYINGQRKATPRQIFMFQHAILFSKPAQPKAVSRKISVIQAPKYSYKNHVLLTQVGITRFLSDDINNVQFEIKVFKKEGQKNVGESFVIQAGTTAIRDQWIDKIEHLLFQQFANLKNRAASSVL